MYSNVSLQLSQPPIGDNERHMQFVVRERVRGLKLPAARGRGALLSQLTRELTELRDSHDLYKFELAVEGASSVGAVSTKRPSEAPPRSTYAATSETGARHQHRPSLISMLTGRAPPPRTPAGTPDHAPPRAAPRESLSSSSTTSQHMGAIDPRAPDAGAHFSSINAGILAHTGHHISAASSQYQDIKSGNVPFYTNTTKLRFVPSVEFKFTSGETSMTPLSPLSPMEDSSDAAPERGAESRPRLQRSHVPSKKTFKFRRSRKNKPEVAHIRLESECSSPTQPTPDAPRTPPAPLSAPPAPLRRAWPPPLLQPLNGSHHTDTSWDSESQVSQTSSTSGYRESYSLQASTLESPGAAGGARAALASPDPPSASQRTATPPHSPDGSLSCDYSGSSSAERTALLGASQRSLLVRAETKDEDTLI